MHVLGVPVDDLGERPSREDRILGVIHGGVHEVCLDGTNVLVELSDVMLKTHDEFAGPIQLVAEVVQLCVVVLGVPLRGELLSMQQNVSLRQRMARSDLAERRGGPVDHLRCRQQRRQKQNMWPRPGGHCSVQQEYPECQLVTPTRRSVI